MVEHLGSAALLSYYIQCDVCAISTVDLERHFLQLAFNIPIETSNFGASVKKYKGNLDDKMYGCVLKIT